MNMSKICFKKVVAVIVCTTIMSTCFSANIFVMGAINAKAEEEEGMSKNQILQGAEGLVGQLIEYSVTDPDKFAELFIGASEEEIQKEQEFYAGINSGNYEKQYFVLVVNEDPYFLIQFVYYTISGQESSHAGDNFIMSFLDGEWEVNYSEEADDLIYTTENESAIFPAEYAKLRGTEASYGEIPGCFLYLDDAFVWDEYVGADVLFCWENEDGSIDIRIGISNGTPETKNININRITFENDEVGTVLELTPSYNTVIRSGYNKMITLHFESSEISPNGDWNSWQRVDIGFETY